MIPTKDKSIIYQFDNDSLHLGDYDICHQNDKDRYNQHLHFTSDEETEEGEYVIFLGTKEIIKYPKGGFPKGHSRKLVATTDKSLNNFHIHKGSGKYWDDDPIIMKNDLSKPLIPQITENFIELYIKLGGIEEISIEETINIKDGYCANCNGGSDTSFRCTCNRGNRPIEIKLIKLDDKGCVIVSPLTKEYTYDDITHALAYGYGARRDGLSHHQALINYKESNL